MKILQATPVFYPAVSFGGIVGVSCEISKLLVKKGHSLTIFTTDADKGKRIKDKSIILEGINVLYDKNISNTLAWRYRLFTPISMIFSFEKYLKNFDVVHVHDYRTLISILASHYCFKYDVPYLVQPHGSITSNKNKTKSKKLFDILFGYKILKNATAILALNETEADTCREIGVTPSRIKIVPNGVKLSEFQSLSATCSFKQKYNINSKIILYIGRIDRSKGIDLLIMAFKDLINEFDGVKLVIIGPDDGYAKTLNKLCSDLGISDDVLFTGFISNEDKWSAYADADIFVTPSFYGFPLTFLEAMMWGVPIITTNYGDYIDGIDNVIGYVTEYKKEMIKSCMLELLKDDNLRNKFSLNSKDKIQEFSWECLADRLESIYHQIGCE